MRYLAGFSFLAILFLGLSCSKSNQHSESAKALAEKNPELVVEGYIEFLGPHEKWAGPQTFIIHISTWETQEPVITLTPKSVSSRSPASEVGANSEGIRLSIDEAREELARLSVVINDAVEPYSGCLHPIRVRLIRVDGALLERQACRGQAGWPQVASEVAHGMMGEVFLATQ